MTPFSDELADEDEGLSPEMLERADFFLQQVAGMEETVWLQATSRLGGDIAFDLQRMGPLGTYLRSRREEAAKALDALIEVDPADTGRIAALQAVAKEYLRAVHWVIVKDQEARHAQDQLKAGQYGQQDSYDDGVYRG